VVHPAILLLSFLVCVADWSYSQIVSLLLEFHGSSLWLAYLLSSRIIFIEFLTVNHCTCRIVLEPDFLFALNRSWAFVQEMGVRSALEIGWSS